MHPNPLRELSLLCPFIRNVFYFIVWVLVLWAACTCHIVVNVKHLLFAMEYPEVEVVTFGMFIIGMYFYPSARLIIDSVHR